jgi:murein L,D-transpeptidase YafK/Tfp pilus assembly protein PilX
MLRIFKEEGAPGALEGRIAHNRFEKVRNGYEICAWSGKLGPKVKEGDRQAPEGFYNLTPAHLNPNSKYYLAINTGFPNRYDAANGRNGTNLMIHGACSSSGCYSMTDAQILEIYGFARDAFKGGQKTVQLQAFPFRMTAENMARHRQSEHLEFWKMLKVGYDNFEVTKRPPEVNVCEKKYVFNQQTEGGSFNASAQCPAMSTPPALVSALSSYEKTYDLAYEKAMSKYDGMAWYDPSEAERKALVAEKRKGREPAYAPTGSALKAGKLMTAREIADQKRKAEEAEKRKVEAAERAVREAEEAKLAAEKKKVEEAEAFAADVAAEKAAKQAQGKGALPVPEENPGVAVVEKKEPKPFWKLWAKDDEPRKAEPVPTVTQQTQQQATTEAGEQATRKEARNPATETAGQRVETPAEGAGALPVPGDNASVEVVEKKAEKPFWKFWQK